MEGAQFVAVCFQYALRRSSGTSDAVCAMRFHRHNFGQPALVRAFFWLWWCTVGWWPRYYTGTTHSLCQTRFNRHSTTAINSSNNNKNSLMTRRERKRVYKSEQVCHARGGARATQKNEVRT